MTQIRNIMTSNVELTDPNTTIFDAARRMRSENIGALPVGENDRLIGMVTDRDIVLRAVAENRPDNTTKVRDVMSEKVCYCFEDDEPVHAAQIMSEYQVRRLPVLNRKKRLVGMLTLADLSLCEPDTAKIALQGVSQRTGESRRMSH
jgi:CBS domain-containing protein